jgi:hypothetical protein
VAATTADDEGVAETSKAVMFGPGVMALARLVHIEKNMYRLKEVHIRFLGLARPTDF